MTGGERELWERVEDLVENVIQYYGWAVVPNRKFNDDYGESVAPMLESDDWKAVLPDIRAVKDGRVELVEVKMKKTPNPYRKEGGILQHGVDTDNWHDYNFVQNQEGVNVWLFIYEELKGNLLRQKLDDITVHHEHPNGGADGEHMTYFNRSLFGAVPLVDQVYPDDFSAQLKLETEVIQKRAETFVLFPNGGQDPDEFQQRFGELDDLSSCTYCQKKVTASMLICPSCGHDLESAHA